MIKSNKDNIDRARNKRKTLKLSQEELAKRSGVSFCSVKRFENTGEISLTSLLKIAVVLVKKILIRCLLAKIISRCRRLLMKPRNNFRDYMNKNKMITVKYHDQIVGHLALTSEHLAAFEYDSVWLRNGFSISPFKLPLEKKVFVASREPFNGNFGVFADSLPDGWGRLLIDRMLIKMRVNPAEVSILDRLAILGKTGMGVLEYVPEYKIVDSKISNSLEELEQECEKILNERYDGVIEQLFVAGGSSGGARPKILTKIDDEDLIIKFRSSHDPKDIGKIEYRYSQIAKQVGIKMPETRLFDEKYFGVKRFDQLKNGEKVHMLSASALLDASHCLPALDYSDLMKSYTNVYVGHAGS